MRRILAIGLLIALGWFPARADEPSLELNRRELYEGESAVLTVKVPGGGSDTQAELTSLPDVKATLSRRESQNWQNVTVINGRMQREGFNGMILQYTLLPLRQGTFSGGSVNISSGGRTWSLALPSFQVMPVPRQDAVQLELLAEPGSLLPDEAFTVTLRLRVKRLPPPYENAPPFPGDSPPLVSLPFLDQPPQGVEAPDLNKLLPSWIGQGRQGGFRLNGYTFRSSPFDMDGFFDNPFGERPARFLPPGVPVEVDGQSYFEYSLAVPYTAREEGVYSFGPASLKGPLLVGADRAGRGLPREFFSVAKAVLVRVMPPPDEGRPASYFGLMGSNLVAEARLNLDACREGDPLKLALRIRGNLNWRNAGMPDLSTLTNLASLFQVYPSTLQATRLDDGREFTVTLRPRQSGTLEIPSLPISWYDAGTRSYQTAHTDPIPLRVEPASELASAAWPEPSPGEAPGGPPEEARKSPSALRFNEPTLPDDRLPLPFWILLAAGPVLWGGMVAGRKIRAFRESRLALNRRRRALPLALAGLRALEGGEAARPRSDRLYLLLRDFAADLLDRDPGGLTPPDWSRLLVEAGCPPALASRFEERMAAAFESAYSPAGAQVNPNLPDLPGLLRSLEAALAVPSRASRSAPALLLLLVLALGAEARAEAPPSDRQFAWEEAQSLAMRASAPGDFRQAAQRYNQLVAQGVRNGEVFYNLGTCLLLAGDSANAARAFVRAERYLGRPPDLVHNLELAGVPAPWDRTLLFLHFGLPLAARLWLAAGFLVLFCGACAAGRRNAFLRLLAAVSLLALVLFGSSVTTTLFQEAAETPLVLK